MPAVCAQDEAEKADSAGLADRHPAFLKDHGDALFRAGNFAGAVNAYTRALQLAGRAASAPSCAASAGVSPGFFCNKGYMTMR